MTADEMSKTAVAKAYNLTWKQLLAKLIKAWFFGTPTSPICPIRFYTLLFA